jgi:hypothetical protein
MKLWKATLILAAALLFFARPASAQCEDDSAPNCGPEAFYDPSNNFYSPANNLYPPSVVTYALPSSGSGQQSESLTDGVNDGEYIPSEFVDYDRAVALGYQQLREMTEGPAPVQVSFAEAARRAVAKGRSDRKATVIAGQDANGNLQVCDVQNDQCNPL